MNYISRVKELKKIGYSIKAIACLAEINVGTLYNYVSGKTNLSKAAKQRLNAALELIENIRGTDNDIISKSKRSCNT